MSLKDYIQGNRHGKEANRLEREAMNDPFLQGALDGFESVDGDHSKIIEQLEKEFSRPAEASQSKKRKFLYWAMAASILLLIGFGIHFLQMNKNSLITSQSEEQLAENKNINLPDTSFLGIKNEDIIQSDAKLKPALIAETNKKVLPAPKTLSNTPAESENLLADKTAEAGAKLSLEQPAAENSSLVAEVKPEEKAMQTADSLHLIASYIGYEPQQINPSEKNKTFALKPDGNSLSEVVVVGYGVQKKQSITGAVSRVLERRTGKMNDSSGEPAESNFGEKEFQALCQQKADKNICEGRGAAVKVSFFIDEAGKPSNIEYIKFTCEKAREEIEKLLSSSPVWAKVNRKITMTVKW